MHTALQLPLTLPTGMFPFESLQFEEEEEEEDTGDLKFEEDWGESDIPLPDDSPLGEIKQKIRETPLTDDDYRKLEEWIRQRRSN